MKPRGLAGVYGTRWTAGHGIRCEAARDERGLAPGQWGDDRHDRQTRTAVLDTDDVPVTCWCEAEIVTVPLALVRAGLTYSCGTDECCRREERACEQP